MRVLPWSGECDWAPVASQFPRVERARALSSLNRDGCVSLLLANGVVPPLDPRLPEAGYCAMITVIVQYFYRHDRVRRLSLLNTIPIGGHNDIPRRYSSLPLEISERHVSGDCCCGLPSLARRRGRKSASARNGAVESGDLGGEARSYR